MPPSAVDDAADSTDAVARDLPAVEGGPLSPATLLLDAARPDVAIDARRGDPADASVSPDRPWDIGPPPGRDAPVDQRPDASVRKDTAPDSRPAADIPIDSPPPPTPDAAPDQAIDLPPPPPDAAPDLPVEAPRDLPADPGADRGPDAAVDLPPAICGNGSLQAPEVCDDGNAVDDDGCSNDCTLPRCGDGITQVGEQCDDGNDSDDDRCTTACAWVPFVQLTGDPCGLRSNGMVTCWGQSFVPPAARFESIASNECGVMRDGRLACWGTTPPPPAGLYTRVAAGHDFVCGIRRDLTLECTGGPEYFPPSGTFTRLSAMRHAACAIRTDGRILCWGDAPHITDRGSIPPGSNFADVFVGGHGACANTTDGRTACWGVSTPANLTSITMLNEFGCGVRRDRSALCWEDSVDGIGSKGPWPGPYTQFTAREWGLECGLRPDGTVDCQQHQSYLPPTGPPVHTIYLWGDRNGDESFRVHLRDGLPGCGVTRDQPCASFAFGDAGSCGIAADGTLTCWPAISIWSPPPPGTFRQVVVGEFHGCAIESAGTLACWGPVPGSGNGEVAQPPGGTFTAIAGRSLQNCALRSDGALACWGYDSSWEAHPPPPGQFVEVDIGLSNACAVDAAGVITCWGPGPLTGQPAPRGLHGISVGVDLACGLDASGEARCWGPAATWRMLPDGPWRSVKAAKRVCGLRRNGQLVCVGSEVNRAYINGDSPL
jgi:cysteine-rich repeat protein